ncbi:hypothetical protein [Actinacidiphila glaucinigra]|uniref:hypothetical protein n=1 Tax=Actinacidiphila glaucinigra TaxID=235986 RepID=UPI0036ECFB91
MEQSRGPNIPLVQAAGTDPAYVPGILVPEPDDDDTTGAAASGTGGASDAAADVTTGTVPSPATAADESATVTGTGTGTGTGTDDDDDVDDVDEVDDDEATEGTGENRVFEAADRRGAIRADRRGLTFRLDDTEAEFLWKEIRAVEVDVPTWGRRFGVTVYLSERRWFEAWADAPSRRQLRSWSDEFDAILDVYFEADTEKHDSVEQ